MQEVLQKIKIKREILYFRDMKDITLIVNKSELGAGTRGASMGYQALNVAALDLKNPIFSDLEKVEIDTENELLYKEIETPKAKRIQGINHIYKKVSQTVNTVLGNNKFPLVISGDHSSAGATIAGIKTKYPEKKLGVIWVDAHADLHSPYTTPSGNVHGMPLAAAMGLDNISSQINQLDETTKNAWEEMKNIGGISPKISPTDLIFIGLRDFEQPEQNLIDEHNIKVITVSEMRELGTEHTVKTCDAYLVDCDMIYISYDVDSLDNKISEGTGTPVPHGLHIEEAKEILTGLISGPKVVCFEITEINPTLDDSNKMAEVNVEILQECLVEIMKK